MYTPKQWSVIDGHYPTFKEVTGPSFKLSVVMLATDLTEDDYEKRTADLHLIAAAPDLLEALRAILTQHCSGGLVTEAHWALARAAVTKAKGETK